MFKYIHVLLVLGDPELKTVMNHIIKYRKEIKYSCIKGVETIVLKFCTKYLFRKKNTKTQSVSTTEKKNSENPVKICIRTHF